MLPIFSPSLPPNINSRCFHTFIYRLVRSRLTCSLPYPIPRRRGFYFHYEATFTAMRFMPRLRCRHYLIPLRDITYYTRQHAEQVSRHDASYAMAPDADINESAADADERPLTPYGRMIVALLMLLKIRYASEKSAADDARATLSEMR